MNTIVGEVKLTKLVHIEPDTIPDAGDYNALVDCVNALAELIMLTQKQMQYIQNPELAMWKFGPSEQAND